MGNAVGQTPPGNREAKALLILSLPAALAGLVVFYSRPDPQRQVLLAYAMPAVLVAALALAAALARLGTAPVPWALFLLGLAFIVGGAALDITATVIHTPDLGQEQNPIARALLDSGHGVDLVYAYAAVCQSLYMAFLGCSWLGLLRHRRAILDSVRGSRTFLELVKAATGGSGLTWRQWCLPLRLSELPQAYHLFWLVAVLAIASSLDRWYLGMEWYGLLSGGRWAAFAAALTAGPALYFLWLWLAARRSPPG
jgi:hypothetical protein